MDRRSSVPDIAHDPAQLTQRPRFASGLTPSSERETVRAKWVAEQHFVYEKSNDADIIMLSMKSRDPLVTAVVAPVPNGPPTDLLLVSSIEEQREFYAVSRRTAQIREAEIFNSWGAPWYGLVSGVLTMSMGGSEQPFLTDFVGFLPVTDDEDTFKGEIGYGRMPAGGRGFADKLSDQRAALNFQDRRLAAISSGNIDEACALYAEGCQIASRAYPGESITVLKGPRDIRAFYEDRLRNCADLAVGQTAKVIEGWYSFAEFIWQRRLNDGTIKTFKTADITILNPEGLVAFQVGYGTDIELIPPG